jgi:hypothetical protein
MNVNESNCTKNTILGFNFKIKITLIWTSAAARLVGLNRPALVDFHLVRRVRCR